MSQGGEPIHLKRRTSRPLDDDGQPMYEQDRVTTGQHQISPITDEDEYPEESPRRNTSVVRYKTGPQGSNLPSPRPPTTPVPGRRPQGTRDLALRPSQPRDTTGRLPRNTTSSYSSPRNTTSGYQTTPTPNRNGRGPHWLLPLGIGMIAMLVLFVIGSLVVTWGGQIHDNFVYGTPRTYQTDAVVGHGDSKAHPSHFIAINYNRQAVVVEWMAGNPAKSVDYVVPYYIVGDNSNLTPVTVEFRDVNGDGKPDMVIHIHLKNQDQTFVFINDGTKFRAPTASDKIQL